MCPDETTNRWTDRINATCRCHFNLRVKTEHRALIALLILMSCALLLHDAITTTNYLLAVLSVFIRLAKNLLSTYCIEKDTFIKDTGCMKIETKTVKSMLSLFNIVQWHSGCFKRRGNNIDLRATERHLRFF